MVIPHSVQRIEGYALALKNPDPYLTDRIYGGMNYSLSVNYTSKKFLIESAASVVTSHGKSEPSTDIGKKNILFDSLGVQSGGPEQRLRNI